MARPAGSAALKRRLMRNLQRHATMHLWEKDLRPYSKVGYTVI